MKMCGGKCDESMRVVRWERAEAKLTVFKTYTVDSLSHVSRESQLYKA